MGHITKQLTEGALGPDESVTILQIALRSSLGETAHPHEAFTKARMARGKCSSPGHHCPLSAAQCPPPLGVIRSAVMVLTHFC